MPSPVLATERAEKLINVGCYVHSLIGSLIDLFLEPSLSPHVSVPYQTSQRGKALNTVGGSVELLTAWWGRGAWCRVITRSRESGYRSGARISGGGGGQTSRRTRFSGHATETGT